MKLTLRAKLMLALRVFIAAFSVYFMYEHIHAGNYAKAAIVGAFTLLIFAPYIILILRIGRIPSTDL